MARLDRPRTTTSCEKNGAGNPVGHGPRPLGEHLADYRAYLVAKGDTAAHVAKAIQRVRDMLEGCGFQGQDEIEATHVVAFLEQLRNKGTERVVLDPRKEWYTKAELVAVLRVHPAGVASLLHRAGLDGQGQGRARRYARSVVVTLQDRLCRGLGPATRNHYLTAAKGFTRWLVREQRLFADPLAHVARQDADADIRRPRRPLPEALFVLFVEMTIAGKSFRGLTGADRLVLYTLAANTGFRVSELASLKPSSFLLAGDTPTVTVEAGYARLGRKDVQPLRLDVAEMMRRYLVGKPRKQLLWPGSWKEDGADMVRHDLAAAGIPYQDDAGRYFDFHAMRGQFIGLLASKGVHPKVAQVLARHSTITLTMDYYTQLNMLDVARALDKLPQLPGSTGSNHGHSPSGSARARR